MSWGLGWKRPSEVFHLTLHFGDQSAAETAAIEDSTPVKDDLVIVAAVDEVSSGKNVSMEWTAGDDEDQVALRLQSKLMVAIPAPEDAVVVELKAATEKNGVNSGEEGVKVEMRVVKRREALRVIKMGKAVGSGQGSDGIGVLTRLLRSKAVVGGVGDGSLCFKEHWDCVTVLSLSSCAISVSFLFTLVFNFQLPFLILNLLIVKN